MLQNHRLPVEYSVVDSDALARLIGTLYGWADVRCQLIKGTMRDVYEVQAAEQQAILYLYRHGERTAHEIDAEFSVMTHLSLHGLHVPLPIPQINQQNVFSLLQPEGERFAIMGTYQQGQSIGRQITAEMSHRVGALIAQTHHTLDSLTHPVNRPVLDFQAGMQQALLSIKHAAPHRDADVRELHDLSDQLGPQISRLSSGNASYGLLHGDIIPSNILSQSSDLVLLDFDLCAYGWRGYDVASFLVEIAWWAMGHEVRDAFLNSYIAVRPMSQTEIDSLAAIQVIRGILMMGLAARHINTWGRVTFSEATIDKFLAIIRASAINS